MKKFITGALGFAVPAIALAQTNGNLGNISNLLRNVGDIVNIALPIIVALALLFFFYGLAKFILASGDEEARKQGKHIMIWGIVALFVMVSVWGLVAFIGQSLGISQGQSLPNVPRVQLQGN